MEYKYEKVQQYQDAATIGFSCTKKYQHTTGQLTHTSLSNGAPEPDGALQKVVRDKIRHYRQIYLDRPDPIACMPVAVDTSVRVYDDFSRLLFLHTHRETSSLSNELPEESDQLRLSSRYLPS